MSSSEGDSEQNLEIQQSGAPNDNFNQSAEQIAIAFGENAKAQMAAKAMFQLVHTHGDILREGWKNVLDCILRLFYARLLPNAITEVEDFVDPKGWVSIQRAPPPKLSSNRNDSGLLSWLGLGSSYDNKEPTPTPDQQQLIKMAQAVIAECHPEQLIVDGKYLTSSALSELINAIFQASTSVAHKEAEKTVPSVTRKLNEQEEDALVLYLEMMVSIALENKDRLSQIWTSVRQHLQWLLNSFGRNPLIVERAVVGLLRIANRNLFRLKDDVADEVLQSLGMLLKLPAPAMFMFSRQIAYGLHELLRTNAANVHRSEHWAVLFGLLEAAGAGAYPEDLNSQCDVSILSPEKPKLTERQVHSDTEPSLSRLRIDDISEAITVDRGYTSDVIQEHIDSSASLAKGTSTEWIHIDHRDAALAVQQQQMQLRSAEKQLPFSNVFDRGTVVLRANLMRHDPLAFLKVGETLAFLVRDAAHITPDNFDSCVECLRSYTEASLDGGRYASGPLSVDVQSQLRSVIKDEKLKRSNKQDRNGHKHMSLDARNNNEEETSSSQAEPQQLSASYQQVAFQMLDLCHTLHVKGAAIYRSWADGGAQVDASPPALWDHCWRPLLQCIVRLCCDCRRQVRTQALNFLVRSFLIPEMQIMGGRQWEQCFGEVLFPFLQKLLENLSPMDPIGMEETRVRAMQLISKILLNHLTPLSSLESFPSLWLRLLDYMDQYLHADRSDLLSEAIPESLKNMILVMDNTRMFCSIPDLYDMTVKRMGAFLPELLAEVMPGPPTKSEEPTPTESIPPSRSTEIIAWSSGEAGSVLPQQFVVGGRVLIAPPVDLFRPQKSAKLRTDDAAKESKTEETADPSGATRQIPIPELEEVIVHSGGTSPTQSYLLNAPKVGSFPTAEPAIFKQGCVDEALWNQRFVPLHAAQMHSGIQVPRVEGIMQHECAEKQQFSFAPLDTFRIAPPHLLHAQQQQQQQQQQPFPIMQPAQQTASTAVPVMTSMPLVSSPNSAFSPPPRSAPEAQQAPTKSSLEARNALTTQRMTAKEDLRDLSNPAQSATTVERP